MDFQQVKIEIFVPAHFVAPLREALQEAGAGRLGAYDHCLSVTQVTGYWRPLAGAQPYDGVVGAISEGTECKIEVRCPVERVKVVVRAIRAVHPYEEPVINVIPLISLA